MRQLYDSERLKSKSNCSFLFYSSLLLSVTHLLDFKWFSEMLHSSAGRGVNLEGVRYT